MNNSKLIKTLHPTFATRTTYNYLNDTENRTLTEQIPRSKSPGANPPEQIHPGIKVSSRSNCAGDYLYCGGSGLNNT